ncbi:MAG: hypothetical protein GY861_02870 [bacterium]|nr:hypothetical protein [bacterium]
MKYILTVLVLLIATPTFAATSPWQWCAKDGDEEPIQPLLDTCVTATILDSGTEVIDLCDIGKGLVGGPDSNKWDEGYHKMITGENTPLQEFQIYSGWLYSFENNVFIKTNQVVSNYDNMTLNDFKWQTYWKFMNDYVMPVREQDCIYSGKVIPKTARVLMVEAISAGRTMTYEVYNQASGVPDYFTRTAAQASGVLDYCLDAVNAVNTNIKVKSEAIMACTDADCVNAIDW